MYSYQQKLLKYSSLGWHRSLFDRIGVRPKTNVGDGEGGGQKIVCLFVLRFYGPVNPMGSCRARSVYLTTRLLGRLSPLSG